ncbi:MAG: hypothetical protein U1A72_19205 [Sulfuritalea sp.]|nr:hypothetical protein [Sulfuritalea sp.]
MKKSPTAKPQKKILVSVWTLLYSRLNEAVDAAFLKRDAFLDYVLRSEALHLEKDIPVPGNSDLARAFLDQQLKTLDLAPMSLNLSPETIEAINSACKSRNIPRDCFINRTLLFVCSGRRNLWERLLPDLDWDHYLRKCRDEWGSEVATGHHWGALRAIESCLADAPFWSLRMVFDLARDDDKDERLYMHQIIVPANFFTSPEGKNWQFKGLNCFLPDHEVEGSDAWAAYKEKQKAESNEFLKLLDQL